MFHKIVGILKESQFSELINRVEEQINEGKIIEDEVKTFKETFGSIQTTLPLLSSHGGNLKPSSKVSFSIIAPYTPKERLEILFDIIEQTLITPLQIERYLKDPFLKEHSFQNLEFVSQNGEVTASVDSKKSQYDESLGISIDQLRAALTSLRKEL